MTQIHPTAVVDPKAHLGKGTKIGAFSVIGPDVVIGEGTEIQEHVVIRGRTTIGDEVKIHPFCVVGGEPQHLKYQGEPSTVEIHNRVVLREMSTVHRGTAIGINKTVIADDAYLMAYTHVAHDCMIGKNVIVCSNVQLAGHVILEDHVVLGGQSAVAQFCRIGRYCYVGGGSTLRKDLPPFLLGKGSNFKVQGVNVVGLERHGFSPSTVLRLKKLYKIFYIQKHTIAQAAETALAELGDTDEIRLFLEFIKTSTAGFIR